ncbi:MAG TPA: SGNH/GDSL hydrolase family protein [Pyrinomonadaceae bacterium]|nr:SGNH/GDSL hydrolase family protein [Pyrinomonadaceae bacterium]
MRVLAPSAKLSRIAALAAVTLLSLTSYGQTTPRRANGRSERVVNLLVLGDSISWGQGLKDEHKAWYLVKRWLEVNTGREVRAQVEAHSGALIGTAGEADPRTNYALDGELSRGQPTVNDQIDNALRSFTDPAQVDLVLVDGCINDLDSRRLLNGANTPDNIRELAQAKCGAPVEALLSRITSTFPAANVVIFGYYPIITEFTANDLFMRTLAKRFYTPATGEPRLNDKALRARLIAISREWYQTSDQMLANAARKIDSELTTRGSRQRVLFADAAFQPEHSFAANKSRLWGFDASALRKFLVVLTLGKVQLRTNDERRSQRSELCANQFRQPAGETPEQKALRKDRLMRCRLAAVGHPNRKGAAMYADAIGKLLKGMMTDSGWLGGTKILAAPANPVP